MLAMDRISDPQVSPDGKRVAFVLRTTDLEANRGRTDLWLVGADGAGLRQLTSPPGRRLQPALGARRPPDLLPVHALRLVAGLADRRRRRRGRAGDPPAARRVEPRCLARRQDPGLLPRGLPRTPRRSRRRPTACEAGEAAGLRPDLRPALRPPLGHLGGRPALPPLRPARRRRRAGRPHAKHGRRRPSKPFGGAEEFAFTPDGKGDRLHRQGRRARGGLVDQLRPLRRRRSTAPRRRATSPRPTRPGTPSRRSRPTARRWPTGHGAARLRGRPLPHHAAGLAGRPGARR